MKLYRMHLNMDAGKCSWLLYQEVRLQVPSGGHQLVWMLGRNETLLPLPENEWLLSLFTMPSIPSWLISGYSTEQIIYWNFNHSHLSIHVKSTFPSTCVHFFTGEIWKNMLWRWEITRLGKKDSWNINQKEKDICKVLWNNGNNLIIICITHSTGLVLHSIFLVFFNHLCAIFTVMYLQLAMFLG
jgi:hypothetical protein